MDLFKKKNIFRMDESLGTSAFRLGWGVEMRYE